MKCTLVVGLGSSGIGAAQLLNAEGKKVIVFEKNKSTSLNALSSQLIGQGIHVELGKTLEIKNFQPLIKNLESVVIGPGIAWDHPTLNELRKKGIKVQGEISLAWERLKHFSWIGVTGTNGKTTVTHLINHLLESNGLIAPMGGNVGNAASALALELRKSTQGHPNWLVMELSSYQIESAPELAPQIGIWTNLTPDHLERHETLDNYRQIKRGLLEQSKIRIFNADDPDLSRFRDSWDHGIWISTNSQNLLGKNNDLWIDHTGMIIENANPLFHSSALKIPGKHNQQNLLLATAAARQIGLSGKAIENSLHSFLGIPHRLEFLGKINHLAIFNDSKATNYNASTIGILAVPAPAIVIAGGEIKKGEPSEWISTLHKRVNGLILFGSSATNLRSLIQSSKYSGELYCCEGLHQAVSLAIELGIKLKARSLILSPACASFDQYQNYEDRGNHFKRIIKPEIDP